MNGITAGQIDATVYVLLAVFAALITLDKVVDIVKRWKTPSTETAKKLATDKLRLDEHEKEISILQKSNQIILASLMALLDHELHNGNTDQMQKASDDIMRFLQENLSQQ